MKYENTIQIEASQPVVWDVTQDVERWPEWAPTIQGVTRLDNGPFRVGSSARIKQPGLPEAVWRVSALSAEESFTWETRVLGMHLAATHLLIPSGAGTRSELRLEVSGVVAILLWPLILLSVPRSLDKENVGLKARCEVAAERSR